MPSIMQNSSSIRDLVESIDHHPGWDRLFREIREISAEYDLPCKASKKVDNRSRNRYRDVSPYDHSRVQLIEGQNDYINSNLVEIESSERRYILCQGPLPGTSGHLWQMVWEQNSKAVIMLNKVIEKGTRKCHQYWPLDRNNPMNFEEEGFVVALKHETTNPNFIIRELELSKTKGKTETPRIILQFHYIAWPDFGVPESPTAFLEFLSCVRAKGVLENDVGPSVIHCSAGIGRSGTFALVDTCFVCLEKNIPFDIRETLLEMRKYRMGLIQTAQQLRFSYLAIAQCETLLKRINERKIEVAVCDSDSESESEEEEEEDPPPPGPGSNGDSNHISQLKQEEPEHKGDKGSDRKRHTEDQSDDPKNEKREKQEEPIEVIDAEQSVNESVQENEVTVPTGDNNNKAKNEDTVRQRRIEKKEALSKKVATIKNNMKIYDDKKKHPWKKYVLGGLLASVVIGIAVRYYWYS